MFFIDGGCDALEANDALEAKFDHSMYQCSPSHLKSPEGVAAQPQYAAQALINKLPPANQGYKVCTGRVNSKYAVRSAPLIQSAVRQNFRELDGPKGYCVAGADL